MAAQSTTGEALGNSLSQNNSLTMNREVEVSETPQKMPSPSLGTATTELYTKMLNPIMRDMEKATMKSSYLLDNIDRELKQEREARIKKNRTAHVPEVLKGGGLDSEEVLRKVEQLIFFAEKEDGTIQLQDHIRLRELDPEGKTGVVASSLRAYMSMLPEQELKRVVSKITTDCQLWLSRLLRFEDACVTYHEEEREGLVRVCRLALYLRYPKYATDGFDALYSRPPVIYLSAAAPPDLPRYLCLQLGLPLSSISTVPCNTVFGASRKMDVAMLEKLIQDDIAAAKTPVLLLAYAGTPAEGHVDNIQRLQEVCHTHSIWLHLQGNCLATLPLFSEVSELVGAATGDSITITPGPWIGVPGLPSATVFKASDVTLVHAAGLNTFNTSLKLNGLPMWMSLLALGHQGVVDRVTHCCHLAKLMCDKLSQISSIKLISRAKSEASSDGKPLMQTLSKALSPLTVFEMANPTVVFRYTTDIVDDSLLSPYDVRQTDGQTEATSDAAYFDALNIWLQETLDGTDPRVTVDTVMVDKEGVCLRFSPVETAQASGTTEKDIEDFVVSLLSSLAVLNASTRQRRHFQSLVHAQSNLILLTVPSWAGLGAVSYIPDMFLGKDELNEEELDTIDTLNYDILQELKAKDSAFSLGETEAGRICVKFGLITDDTNVQELVELVQAAGEEIEDSSKFMDNMTEMIQKGIVEANKELQKEQENKLIHEGVLRQIPMVGSMLNWLQPIKEDVKGRTFSLASGHVRSTEETYRHHMQVQEEGEAVALGPLLSSRRSRTSSMSSTASSVSRQISAQSSLSPDAHIGTPAQTT